MYLQSEYEPCALCMQIRLILMPISKILTFYTLKLPSSISFESRLNKLLGAIQASCIDNRPMCVYSLYYTYIWLGLTKLTSYLEHVNINNCSKQIKSIQNCPISS